MISMFAWPCSGKTPAGGNLIVVPDAERAPARTDAGILGCERKMLPGPQPTEVLAKQFLKRPAFDHRLSSVTDSGKRLCRTSFRVPPGGRSEFRRHLIEERQHQGDAAV